MRFGANSQAAYATSAICMPHPKTRKTCVDAGILKSLVKRNHAVMHAVRRGGAQAEAKMICAFYKSRRAGKVTVEWRLGIRRVVARHEVTS